MSSAVLVLVLILRVATQTIDAENVSWRKQNVVAVITEIQREVFINMGIGRLLQWLDVGLSALSNCDCLPSLLVLREL